MTLLAAVLYRALSLYVAIAFHSSKYMCCPIQINVLQHPNKAQDSVRKSLRLGRVSVQSASLELSNCHAEYKQSPAHTNGKIICPRQAEVVSVEEITAQPMK